MRSQSTETLDVPLLVMPTRSASTSTVTDTTATFKKIFFQFEEY